MKLKYNANTRTRLGLATVQQCVYRDYAMEREVSVALIAKRNIPNKKEHSVEEIADAVLQLTHVRLDREGITRISNLDCLGPVTNLYLQQNKIGVIENLEVLPRLRFLSLSGNNIVSIKNLKCLSGLKFLDLSDNAIEVFDAEEFPSGLIILALQGNPCTSHPDYKSNILQVMPALKQLDEEDLTEDPGGSDSSESEGVEDAQTLDSNWAAPERAENKCGLKQLCNDMIVRAKIRTLKEEKEHERRLDEISQIRAHTRCSKRLSQSIPSKSPCRY